MDARYASRKFVLACVVLFMVWSGFVFGQFTSEQLLDFTTWALGLYMAGNVGDTAAEKLK